MLNSHLENGTLKQLNVECFEKKGRSHKCRLGKVAVAKSEAILNAHTVEAIVNSMIDVAINGAIQTKQTQGRVLQTHTYTVPKISKDSQLLLISKGFADITELSNYKNSEIYELFNSHRNSVAINFEQAVFEIMNINALIRKSRGLEVRKVLLNSVEVSLRTLCKGRA